MHNYQVYIAYLVIHNRVDCCQDRAIGIVVSVIHGGGSYICETITESTKTYNILCGMVGSIVELRRRATATSDIINLAEIKSYGQVYRE